MRRMTMHDGGVTRDTFVRIRHLHQGRLANENSTGTRQIGAKPRDGIERSPACGFLVIAQQNVDRADETRVQKFRDHRKTDGIETLHIAGPAAIEAPGVAAQFEGIACPGLTRHRNDIGVPGENDAAIKVWPYGGKERGFVAHGIGNFHIGNAEGF